MTLKVSEPHHIDDNSRGATPGVRTDSRATKMATERVQAYSEPFWAPDEVKLADTSEFYWPGCVKQPG
jgi:hypothetical protein